MIQLKIGRCPVCGETINVVANCGKHPECWEDLKFIEFFEIELTEEDIRKLPRKERG